ncbi:hypothetical protein B0H34DRAFT_709527 [Crassisporium funariophilum]|nr:hypothetical protein B0H34DRAFT_709527 [Crassisporium funariophilum]
MGDDDFFGSSQGGGAARAQRNPLSLDELKPFSRQLLNWRDDAGARMTETYISKDMRCTWEGVREKVTKCLPGIHA